ncbi:hypothetical protein [Oharaeibacter diazotrophicus]|uniref:Uncharacterized protein n=1 Tax=Oharaeibacter diazotrophicus TaxID=1920512 RepID=A0A4R6REV3_9HYPH|nr:hypothetical protein [Oharaeibacter diazotrophicus]TDP84297.1 hypothetical protein EDD54_2903 [Oharaeibacter diazotrophicus]BBE73334.1 hypothetical protein OHA_1_02944 [Pleomorphomonas sp. SM30]GLS75125.1 hypothetical protein GCM10007904_04600 [Oharaeibacter diazotrophicus]
MDKVVIRRIMATELPAEVRGDIAGDHPVEVTVRDLRATAEDGLAGHFSRHFAAVRNHFPTADSIVAHVRHVRDGED